VVSASELHTEPNGGALSPHGMSEVLRRIVTTLLYFAKPQRIWPYSAVQLGYAVCTVWQVPSGQSAQVPRGRRLLLLAERLLLAFGLIGLLAWGWFQFRAATSTRYDLEQFAALRTVAPRSNTQIDSAPDQALWFPTRISAWRKAIAEPGPAPLAVLRIPKIRLEVPVLSGTDERALDRGLGHIEYTAQPGADGNSGIAGHRDSFLRGLKDIAVGDLIELDTQGATEIYRIERTWIVNPDDVSVLDPTPVRALTLVTCYPFYYVGSAPQRFIVRAVRVSSKPVSLSLSGGWPLRLSSRDS
jgi:sortase A